MRPVQRRRHLIAPAAIGALTSGFVAMQPAAAQTDFYQGKSIELYARHVASSALWGFTEIGELVFDPPGEGLVVLLHAANSFNSTTCRFCGDGMTDENDGTDGREAECESSADANTE